MARSFRFRAWKLERYDLETDSYDVLRLVRSCPATAITDFSEGPANRLHNKKGLKGRDVACLTIVSTNSQKRAVMMNLMAAQVSVSSQESAHVVIICAVVWIFSSLRL